MKINKVFSKRGLVFIKDIICCIFACAIAKFLPKKEIWLITERCDEARDNGYHLYRYINEQHKNENVYYAINKKSKDYYKIKEFGKVIQFGSFKHHLYYWKATKLISTHINGYMPNSKVYEYIHKVLKHKGKKVFLQHGITKDCLPQLFYEKTNLDLFVCGAKPEYEYIKEKFGYGQQVQYLGLCRYDNLSNFKTKDQILIMPTFRMQYYIEKDEKLTNSKKAEFLDSQYYKQYSELLRNDKLAKKLKERNIEIVFYPHYEMQKYIFLFQNMPEQVKIVDNGSYDIQELLKESKMLVTDFSSVFFDFAYMGKPVLYFQFDREEYRNQHYKEGYFSYENNGFGPVEENIDNLISKIMEYIDKNYSVEEKYIERRKKFFTYSDNNNCKRNYESIKML